MPSAKLSSILGADLVEALVAHVIVSAPDSARKSGDFDLPFQRSIDAISMIDWVDTVECFALEMTRHHDCHAVMLRRVSSPANGSASPKPPYGSLPHSVCISASVDFVGACPCIHYLRQAHVI